MQNAPQPSLLLLSETQAPPLIAILFWQGAPMSSSPPPWFRDFVAGFADFCQDAIETFIAAGIPQALDLRANGQRWEAEIILVNDADMAELNEQYRQKTGATDVLTFSLFAESPQRAQWARLPTAQLGSVFLSWEWALAHVDEEPAHRGDAARFLRERLAHGLLHLLGRHHDSEDAYQQVVSLQNQALAQHDARR
ncbi:MAG: rRNA maturation RNase YbeY [Vampirovibrionales bacterium]|nr:rRNA maturation RNase YbeY [Vampirovibrionales bacterium]